MSDVTPPETETQRLLREIRQKRDRADAKVKAALARAAADPRLPARRLVDPAAVAEACRLRIPEIEARIRRLEERHGIASSQPH